MIQTVKYILLFHFQYLCMKHWAWTGKTAEATLGMDREGSSRNIGKRTGKEAAAVILCKDREGSSSSRNIGQGQGRQLQEHWARTGKAAEGTFGKDREGSSSSSRNTGQGQGRQQQEH